MNFQKLLKKFYKLFITHNGTDELSFRNFWKPQHHKPSTPPAAPSNSLFFLLPQRSLGFAHKPLSLPPDPSRPEDGGGRGGRGERAATRFWPGEKERERKGRRWRNLEVERWRVRVRSCCRWWITSCFLVDVYNSSARNMAFLLTKPTCSWPKLCLVLLFSR